MIVSWVRGLSANDLASLFLFARSSGGGRFWRCRPAPGVTTFALPAVALPSFLLLFPALAAAVLAFLLQATPRGRGIAGRALREPPTGATGASSFA